MINADCDAILLDIEGTTSSVSFVYDVMFPYAKRELDAYLTSHWGQEPLMAACQWIAKDAGAESFESWTADLSDSQQLAKVRAEALRQMESDAKATGLKQLQGLIWAAGFKSGEMRAHVYPDVPEAIQAWTQAGKTVCIYSSGSVAAQLLFFGHTEAGDLLPYLSGHYDTTTGPKKETASYTKIAEAMGKPAERILFVSDIVAELDAARLAGMQTALSMRPGNQSVEDANDHTPITSFDQITVG